LRNWNRLTTAALTVAAIALLTVLARLASDAYGGPLDPPAPPASTQSSIEPRTPITQPASAAAFPLLISQPGSYYLASNITGVAGKNGIEITTGNVTLDLNGFRLTAGTSTGIGVYVSGGENTNITVRNGIIDGWGTGIDGTINVNGRYVDLQLLNNTSYALKASSASTIVKITARGGSNGVQMAAGTSGGLIVDSVIAGTSFPVLVQGTDVVIRRTVVGPGSQGVNHGGTALWVDQSQIRGHNFGYVLDGNTAIVTRNTLLQNTGYAGIGINNHIGSNATIGSGTVSSTDAWSNVRY
jgi:hypothetical protein